MGWRKRSRDFHHGKQQHSSSAFVLTKACKSPLKLGGFWNLFVTCFYFYTVQKHYLIALFNHESYLEYLRVHKVKGYARCRKKIWCKVVIISSKSRGISGSHEKTIKRVFYLEWISNYEANGLPGISRSLEREAQLNWLLWYLLYEWQWRQEEFGISIKRFASVLYQLRVDFSLSLLSSGLPYQIQTPCRLVRAIAVFNSISNSLLCVAFYAAIKRSLRKHRQIEWKLSKGTEYKREI